MIAASKLKIIRCRRSQKSKNFTSFFPTLQLSWQSQATASIRHFATLVLWYFGTLLLWYYFYNHNVICKNQPMPSRLILSLLLMLFSPLLLQAQQTIKVKGIVLQETGLPVEFATVAIKGSSQGTSTNQNGEFTLVIPNQFPVIIAATCIGYEEADIQILSVKEVHKTIKINILSKSEVLTNVEVTGTHKPDQSMTRIDANLSTNLPDASGKTIEALVKTQMGVASNNELSSQYRVRGGNYDENLVYVNDIEIYRPFLVHSGQQEGLSFVNPDMVSSLLFSPGGFNASYGDKMSSVLDITYQTPEAFAANAQVSLLGASGHLQTITKNQKFTTSTGIRYKTNEYLLGSLDTKGDYSPVFFDAQTLMGYQFNNHWRLDALAYYSQNSYRFEPTNRETNFGTLTDMKQFTVYFEGKEVDLFQTGFGAVALTRQNEHSRYKLTLSAFQTYEEESYDILGEYWLMDVNSSGETSVSNPEAQGIGIGGFLQHARNDLFGRVMNAALKGTHRLSNHEIKWEGKVQSEYFVDHINEWEMRDSADYSIPYTNGGNIITLSNSYNTDLTTQSIRTTGYILDNVDFTTRNGHAFNVNYGVRFNYWNYNDQFLASPRINLTYKPLNKNLQFRFATGLYYQPPFYKELRTPDGQLNPNIKAHKSLQFVIGGDYFFRSHNKPFKFTSEAYYKKLDDLISYQVDNVKIRYSGKNDAKGYAAGIDFKIYGEFLKGLESWATLGLMKTEEDIIGDSYQTTDEQGNVTTHYPGYIPRPSDQRFNFSMMFQDYLPNVPSFKVHLNFIYASGLPFGPPDSPRYQATYRMPPYRRVDIGFTKDLLPQTIEPRQSAFKQFQIGVEIFNLFDINNTISYYWITDVNNTQYAIPNYLTSRRLNLILTARF
jgi:hypothetical protein